MEELSIQHRNALRHHYTQTSNVLLFGYRDLSDGAKVTYQVIDSFDWSDSAGKRKGFAFPSLATLAKARGVDERTLRRHLAELEASGLITRRARPGRSNLLIIEDASVGETKQYLQTFGGAGEDRNVRPTPDKNIRPYKKEEEKKKDELNHVNEEKVLWEEGIGPSGCEHISETIGKLRTRANERLRTAPTAVAKREYLAQEMVHVLRDEHSLGFYRKIAAGCPPQAIFEALSAVKQAARDGAIRKTRGALFAALVKESATPQ